MRAFVTGINGFAGSYLAEALVEAGHSVGGTTLTGTSLEPISHIREKLQLFALDLTDRNAFNPVLSSFNPDWLFHLAGESSAKASFTDPIKTFNINVMGGLNVLEAVKTLAPKTKILLVTSGDIYGEALLTDKLTDEEVKPIPNSPYGVSKAALDMLGRIYAGSFGLDIIIARPFSHIGPRQQDVFFIPTVARQIAEIKRGKGDHSLRLGELNIFRDFTDVRDVVRAYILLAEKGRKGEAYNICSGKQYLLKELVETMIGLSQKKIAVMLDPERVRRADLSRMKPDNGKIMRETGWRPTIDIKRSLSDVFEYWMKKFN
jgi:GDP-4-dehydro-6-deoxy-D-mannose reductase